METDIELAELEHEYVLLQTRKAELMNAVTSLRSQLQTLSESHQRNGPRVMPVKADPKEAYLSHLLGPSPASQKPHMRMPSTPHPPLNPIATATNALETLSRGLMAPKESGGWGLFEKLLPAVPKAQPELTRTPSSAYRVKQMKLKPAVVPYPVHATYPTPAVARRFVAQIDGRRALALAVERDAQDSSSMTEDEEPEACESEGLPELGDPDKGGTDKGGLETQDTHAKAILEKQDDEEKESEDKHSTEPPLHESAPSETPVPETQSFTLRRVSTTTRTIPLKTRSASNQRPRCERHLILSHFTVGVNKMLVNWDLNRLAIKRTCDKASLTFPLNDTEGKPYKAWELVQEVAVEEPSGRKVSKHLSGTTHSTLLNRLEKGKSYAISLTIHHEGSSVCVQAYWTFEWDGAQAIERSYKSDVVDRSVPPVDDADASGAKVEGSLSAQVLTRESSVGSHASLPPQPSTTDVSQPPAPSSIPATPPSTSVVVPQTVSAPVTPPKASAATPVSKTGDSAPQLHFEQGVETSPTQPVVAAAQDVTKDEPAATAFEPPSPTVEAGNQAALRSAPCVTTEPCVAAVVTPQPPSVTSSQSSAVARASRQMSATPSVSSAASAEAFEKALLTLPASVTSTQQFVPPALPQPAMQTPTQSPVTQPTFDGPPQPASVAPMTPPMITPRLQPRTVRQPPMTTPLTQQVLTKPTQPSVALSATQSALPVTHSPTRVMTQPSGLTTLTQPALVAPTQTSVTAPATQAACPAPTQPSGVAAVTQPALVAPTQTSVTAPATQAACPAPTPPSGVAALTQPALVAPTQTSVTAPATRAASTRLTQQSTVRQLTSSTPVESSQASVADSSAQSAAPATHSTRADTQPFLAGRVASTQPSVAAPDTQPAAMAPSQQSVVTSQVAARFSKPTVEAAQSSAPAHRAPVTLPHQVSVTASQPSTSVTHSSSRTIEEAAQMTPQSPVQFIVAAQRGLGAASQMQVQAAQSSIALSKQPVSVSTATQHPSSQPPHQQVHRGAPIFRQVPLSTPVLRQAAQSSIAILQTTQSSPPAERQIPMSGPLLRQAPQPAIQIPSTLQPSRHVPPPCRETPQAPQSQSTLRSRRTGVPASHAPESRIPEGPPKSTQPSEARGKDGHTLPTQSTRTRIPTAPTRAAPSPPPRLQGVQDSRMLDPRTPDLSPDAKRSRGSPRHGSSSGSPTYQKRLEALRLLSKTGGDTALLVTLPSEQLVPLQFHSIDDEQVKRQKAQNFVALWKLKSILVEGLVKSMTRLAAGKHPTSTKWVKLPDDVRIKIGFVDVIDLL